MCVVNSVIYNQAGVFEYQNIQKDITPIQTQLYRPAQYGFHYGDWPIIKATGKRNFELTLMDWEFRPPWVHNMEEMAMIRAGIDPKTKKKGMPIPWINAKSENLLTSKMWRPAALERRCLVLSDHFFEWRHFFPIGKRGKVLKTPVMYPYAIKAVNEERTYMAGIWTPWKDYSTGEIKETFAIVTTEANEVMRMIHNSKKRMPTFLNEELAEAWLWGNLTEADIKTFGAYQWPSEKMKYHTVAKEFLSSKEPLTEVYYPELHAPDLFTPSNN